MRDFKFLRMISFFGLCGLLIGLSSCNEDEKKAAVGQYSHLKYDSKLSGSHQLNLFLDDMIAMKDLDISSIRQATYCGAYNFNSKCGESVYQRFVEIFGGSKATDVYHYLDERIHYLGSADLMAMEFSFKYGGWDSDPEMEKRLKDNKRGKIGGANIGIQLWLQGEVDELSEPISISFGSETIQLNSSRVGLFVLGEGYSADTGIPFITIPEEVRQTIVVHEARHSDCTKGVSRKSLQELREYKTYAETQANFGQMECGHLHAYCPEGHSFAGLPVCDSERDLWGAYAVQAIFLDALLTKRNVEGKTSSFMLSDYSMINIMVLDSYDRLLYSAGDLKSGKLGKIDLSSGGVTED